MNEDEEFIAKRQAHDDRKFLEAAMDPDVAPRLSPALVAIHKALSEEAPTPYITVLAAAVRSSDVMVKTADGLIRKLVRAGMVRRVGTYSRTYSRRTKTSTVHDTRALFLGDWAS